MFRIRLGKKTVGHNLVRNGDFSEGGGSLTFWDDWPVEFNQDGDDTSTGLFADTVLGSTAVAREVIPMETVSLEAILSQPAIFERGKDYRINFEILDIDEAGSTNVNNSVIVRIGDYSGYQEFKEAGVFSVDRKCLDRGDLNFHFTSVNTSLSNISAYRLGWNDPLTNEPLNILDAQYRIEESEDYDFREVELIDDLDFVGDGYDYLKNLRNTEGIDGIVDVLVEYSQDGGNSWSEYLEGQIAIADCVFDEHEETVTAKIENQSIEALISKNINTEYSLKPSISTGDPYPARIFANKDYLYNAYDELDKSFANGITEFSSMRIEEMLRQLVDLITKSQALVYSNIFGDFDRYGGLSLGFVADVLTLNDTQVWKFSLRDLLDILNNIFNITIEIIKVDGVNIVRIEHKGDLDDETSVLSFDDVRIKRREFLDDLPKSAIFQYEQIPEDTFVTPLLLESGKTFANGQTKEISVPIVKIVATGYFSDAQIEEGDYVLYECEIDSYNWNNVNINFPFKYNYLRPYFKTLVPVTGPTNPNISDLGFIANQWMSTLPFNYTAKQFNDITDYDKSNSQYLEVIEFDTFISDSDWLSLISKEAMKQFIVDPAFNSQNYWQAGGNFSLQNGRAVISSYVANSRIYSTLRENLADGEDYHLQIRIGDSIVMDDVRVDINLYTAGFASGGNIATFTSNPPNSYPDDIYDFFFTNQLANAEIIEIIIESTGASEDVQMYVMEVNLFDTNYQRNLTKSIKVNGKHCKIRAIERNIQNGEATIEAFLKS